MGLTNDEYRQGMREFIREWKREVWPMMQSEGFQSMDVAFSIYMLQRVESSVDNLTYADADEPPEKEPWKH